MGGAHDVWGEAEGCGLARPGEEKVKEKVKEGSHCCIQLKGGYREDRANLSSEMHDEGKKATVTCWRMGYSDYLHGKTSSH